MLARTLILLAILLWSAAADAGPPTSYAEAEAAWKRTRDKPEYQSYAAEFTRFNNYFHLDEKDGCYALPSGTVSLFLVITNTDGAEFALIERALSSVNNPKSTCFKKTYEGLRTKAPPFLPFVLQLSMG